MKLDLRVKQSIFACHRRRNYHHRLQKNPHCIINFGELNMAHMNKYLALNVSQYDGKFPYFRQPLEIGVFSHDKNREFSNDARSRKILRLPKETKIAFDLNEGFDIFESRSDEKEYLNSLLKWLQLSKSKLPSQQHQRWGTDFVCWRGLLTTILCTPFTKHASWRVAVIKHQGTYFMCEYKTEESVERELNRSDFEKKSCYWGYKFEQYICSEADQLEPCTSEAVNNKEDLGCVVRTRLEAHSLVYAGEVDCFEVVDGRRQYVELKTQQEPDHYRVTIAFKRKLLKWWAQSFLLGVPRIVCGFRDRAGFVRRLDIFNTNQLPKIAAEDLDPPWRGNVCFNFLNSFLQFVKTTVVTDNPRYAYVFEYDSRERSRVTVRETGTNPEYCFLPEWFYNSPAPRASSTKHDAPVNYDVKNGAQSRPGACGHDSIALQTQPAENKTPVNSDVNNRAHDRRYTFEQESDCKRLKVG